MKKRYGCPVVVGAFIAAVIAAMLTLLAPVSAQEALLQSEADPARLEAFIEAISRELPYVPGELLVKFRSGVDSVRQASALSLLGGEPTSSQRRWIGQTMHLRGLPDDDAEHAAAILSLQPEVEYAQPNYIRHLHSVPNDPGYSMQWNMNQINMPRAWDINVSAGSGVTVAVLDSGMTTSEGAFNFRFPLPPFGVTFGLFSLPFRRPPDFDFAHILPGTEYTPTGPWSLSSGQPIFFDAVGHGTHVAGTIAQQTNNNSEFAGVAHGVTVVPYKVCWGLVDVIMAWGSRLRDDPSIPDSGCDDSAGVEALRHAVDSGARVLNLSLGGTFPSPAYRDALEYAVSRGAFVSISAGNDALSGNEPAYPAVYANAIVGVVAVGATTPRSTRALYSNFGPYVELVAPGGEFSTRPLCNGYSESIWQLAPDPDALSSFPPRFDRYASCGIEGTSMAAPHVAGAAALLYSQGIRNPAAIEAALKRFAVDLGQSGRDHEFGYGLIDVRSALLGFGLTR